jgi:hypothetical protein
MAQPRASSERGLSRALLLAVCVASLAATGCSVDDPQAHHPAQPGHSTDERPPATTRAATAAAQRRIAPAAGVFGNTSVWRRRVTNAPVGPVSAQQIEGLTRRLAGLYGGIAALNVYQYGVSWVTVPANQPRDAVHWDDCQGKGQTPAGLFGHGGQFQSVPIPHDVAPMPGTDGSLTVYEPATDKLWDFWRAHRDADGWHACWGGRIDRVSRSPGWFPFPYGASASGLAYEAGCVSINDVRSGVIRHAVALQVPSDQVASNPVWPATRSDGENTAPEGIPEGARMRLDPSVNVDNLHLTPIGAMVARAAQKYGFIVTDRSGTLSVPAEYPGVYKATAGVDPWVQLLKGMQPWAVLEGFPWDRVQVLKPGWGHTSRH